MGNVSGPTGASSAANFSRDFGDTVEDAEAELTESVIDRSGGSSSTLPAGMSGDLLRMRLEGPEPPTRSDFTDRMSERFAARPKITLDDIPNAERSGLKGDWNKALAKLANEDLGLGKQAEKALSKLISKQLTGARDGSGDPSSISDGDIKKISDALAGELRNARVGGVSIEALSQGADLLVTDVGLALAKGLSFKSAQDEVRGAARDAGGLFPGEEVELNETIGEPLARDAAAALGDVQKKLDTDFYFKPDAKIDGKKIFSNVAEVLDNVSVDTGFKFTQGDFRAKIGAELTIEQPLTGDASARVRGYAEVRSGGFKAGIEGRATIENLYNDPEFGPTADMSLYMRYSNDKIRASLDARTSIPLHGNRDDFTWSAGASAGYKLSERSSLDFGVGATGGANRDTDVQAKVGFTLRF